MRLLFARVGKTYCIECGREVREESVGDVARAARDEGGRAVVTFEADPPGGRARWTAFRDELLRDGFVRLWRAGETLRVEIRLSPDNLLATKK